MTRAGFRKAHQGSASVRRNAGQVSHPHQEAYQRKAILDRLRESIRRIENRGPSLDVMTTELAAGSPAGLPVEDGGTFPRNAHPLVPSSSPPLVAATGTWTLGDGEMARLVGLHGLATDAVHEIKPAFDDGVDCPGASHACTWAGAWNAACAFVLRMLLRRLQTCQFAPSGQPHVLWCWPPGFAREFGALYAPGLAALGLAPESLIIVEPRRAIDGLWAIEEGLKSAGIACVVGVSDDVGLVPARRLALAAQSNNVPALILTGPRTPPMAGTATRWRVAPAPGGPHPMGEKLPGGLRLGVCLERSRTYPLAGPVTATLEWCDETFCFRLAADAGYRSPALGPAPAVAQAHGAIERVA